MGTGRTSGRGTHRRLPRFGSPSPTATCVILPPVSYLSDPEPVFACASRKRPSTSAPDASIDAAMSTIHGNDATMVPAGTRRERTSRPKGSRLGLIVGAVVVAIAVGLAGGYLLFRDDSPSKSGSDTAASALAAGLQAVIQGHTAQATTKFREVVAIDPKNKL